MICRGLFPPSRSHIRKKMNEMSEFVLQAVDWKLRNKVEIMQGFFFFIG